MDYNRAAQRSAESIQMSLYDGNPSLRPTCTRM